MNESLTIKLVLCKDEYGSLNLEWSLMDILLEARMAYAPLACILRQAYNRVKE